MKKDIFITGGTGFLGTKLAEFWRQRGYNVKAISRTEGVNRIVYPESAEKFAEIINGSKALVNLAGALIVGKRWTKEYKKVLYDSRIDTTKFCAEAIDLCDDPPDTFISSSAIGIYGDRADEVITEESELAGGFVADLCRDWEEAAKIKNDKCSLFISRTGVVLDKGFGALGRMELPFKLFVGGPIGSGKQWFSWVDIDDLIRAFNFAIDNRITGVYNMTSPDPQRMRDFAKSFGKVLNRPSIFPVPEFILRIILGESAQEVTRSQRILPKGLEKAGFKFEYADLEKSLRKIFKK